MSQFPIPPGKKVGDQVALSPDASKHLMTVLRAKKGDLLTLFDGSHRFSGEIVSTETRGVVVRLIDQLPTPRLSGEITLCQAMLKKDKMEWVVQKAVELGAARLIPFSSERTIPKDIGRSKIDRWQKIADEALKQCGRVTPITIPALTNFSELMRTIERDISKILFHSDPTTSPLTPLSQSPTPEKVGGGEVCILIGPEGGFSEKEVEMAKQAGCEIASLGSLTLRAETAAVAALTLIQHELGNI